MFLSPRPAIVRLGWAGVNGGLSVQPAMNTARAVLPAWARWLLLGETIAAVDGPILAGPEGDLARGAAVGTNRVVHLAGATVAASSSIAAAPGLAAGRAALGVLVAATGVELLVVLAEGELGAALGTGEGTVFVGHSMTSLLSRLPRLCAWAERVSTLRYAGGEKGEIRI